VSNLVLAGVATAVLAVLWRRPSAAERTVRAGLQGVDPFHALATRWSRPGAMDDDAVATLLLDDLVTVDAEAR
jgi:hypothetical protein